MNEVDAGRDRATPRARVSRPYGARAQDQGEGHPLPIRGRAAVDPHSDGYWIKLSQWNRYRHDTLKERREDELPLNAVVSKETYTVSKKTYTSVKRDLH